MIAKELISEEIPYLHTFDSGQKTLSLMEVFKVSHLPIVNNNVFLGLISDNEIYDLNNNDDAIANQKLSLFSPFVFSDQHIYEVVAIVSKLKLTLIPVLKRNKEYIGAISMLSLVHRFNQLLAASQPGGIIVLELNMNDYALSEIAQIVESNDAKILSLYINSLEESIKLLVTLKINRIDLLPIVQTFERYNYNVKHTIMEGKELNNMLELRYEEFMKYLSI